MEKSNLKPIDLIKKEEPRVLLINPQGTENYGFFNPPIGLLYLAGTLLKNSIKTELIDGCVGGRISIKNKIKSFKPTIVGIPCFSPTRKKSFWAAKLAKKIDSDILVVMGGMHVTHLYKQVLSNYNYVDICVRGEGERSLLEISKGMDWSQIKGIAFRKDGEIFLTKQRENIQNLDEIPFPEWNLIDFKKYPILRQRIINGIDVTSSPRVSLIFSRGCIGHCNYCAVWQVWGKYRHRSAKNMADEMQMLYEKYGVKFFEFVDDGFTIDKQATLDFCNELEERKLNLKIVFSVVTRADCVDEKILEALKKAGCYQISYGVESASPTILKAMNKNIDIAVSKKAISLTKQAGLKVQTLFITGYFGETTATFNKTIDFLNETNPDRIGVAPGGLYIYPGTNDYFRCQRIGFINDNFWLSNKRCKTYNREYNKLDLIVFAQAFSERKKISDWKIVNYFRYLPHYFRKKIAGYLPEPIRIFYHNIKVKISSFISI